MDLTVRVKEIHGQCPVYKVGDEFRLKEGYKLESSMPLCMHSLSSIMPFYNALRYAEPSELGLGRDDGNAYVQCPDACEYTDGGSVVFQIKKE